MTRKCNAWLTDSSRSNAANKVAKLNSYFIFNLLKLYTYLFHELPFQLTK